MDRVRVRDRGRVRVMARVRASFFVNMTFGGANDLLKSIA